MGSYSKSVVQDLRTVVEGAAETVVSPESVLAEPLSFAVKSGEAIYGKIEPVLPGAIKAGGDVFVEDITPSVIDTIVNSILSSSERQLKEQAEQYSGTIMDVTKQADLWTNALIDSILSSTEKQTEQIINQAKTAVGEIGETTKQLSTEVLASTEQRLADTESEKEKLAVGVKNTALLILVGFIIFFLVRK